MTSKTIGKDPQADLTLKHPSVADWHATATLAQDGTITVTSEGPGARLWLQRGENRLPVFRVNLCLGDRLLFGQEEVELARLTGLFDPASGARLRQRKSPPAPTMSKVATEPAPAVDSPRRNPDTGAIET